MKQWVVGFGVIAFLILGSKLLLAERKIRQLEHEADTLALVISNVTALADTTRLLHLEDSTIVYTKLAVQIAVNDTLSQKLDVAVQARQRLSARVRGVDTVIVVEEPSRVSEEGVRTDTWNIRQPPYTILATTTLPPLPTPGELFIHIDLDAIDFEVRIGCRETEERIAAAEIFLTGPEWLTFEIREVEQTPEICNPSTFVSKESPLWRDMVLGLGSGAIAALVSGNNPGTGALAGGGFVVLWRLRF